MARDTAEIVRRCFDALNRGEIEQALVEAADDFEMDWSNSIGPAKGVYRGKEKVREVWGSYLEAFASVQWDVEEITEASDSLVVFATRFQARGRGSGAAVDAGGAQVWRFVDGRVVRIELYQSKAEALRAAGRSQ